jgi:ubiquitin
MESSSLQQGDHEKGNTMTTDSKTLGNTRHGSEGLARTLEASKVKEGEELRPTDSEITLESGQWCGESPNASKELAFLIGARWARSMQTYTRTPDPATQQRVDQLADSIVARDLVIAELEADRDALRAIIKTAEHRLATVEDGWKPEEYVEHALDVASSMAVELENLNKEKPQWTTTTDTEKQ